jgi:membrane-bound metal-dependent hydrolase YbcI (DUF457 family)
MIEQFMPRAKHRGISHSLIIWILALFLAWHTPLRSLFIGVCAGHLLADSLTIMGIPLLGDKSQRITIFNGLIRTGGLAEYGVAFGFAALCIFLGSNGFSLGSGTNRFQSLYESGIIDRKELIANRFNFMGGAKK